jgi:hypothetical protein
MPMLIRYAARTVPVGEEGAKNFLGDSFAGAALVTICGAIAVVIVVIAILKMVNGIGRGRPGDAFKSLIFGLVIGGLLFDLNLTIMAVKAMGEVVGKVVQSWDDLT